MIFLPIIESTKLIKLLRSTGEVKNFKKPHHLNFKKTPKLTKIDQKRLKMTLFYQKKVNLSPKYDFQKVLRGG